ncbi:MAG: DUF928 domain-containing protein, partial [Synechococcaceae cyanobacterium SM2_3_60]|nr:DUF928 domain-containing protein [Synechococcaceae cyanobacterium SM2_3_60]
MMTQTTTTRWLLSLLLAATLTEALPLPAIAQDVALPAGLSFGYTPPDRGAPRRTRGAGSRGCSNTDNAELQLLIPNDHTGQTIAAHPTLFWYLSEPVTVPLEVTLIDPDRPEPLYSETLTSSDRGIMQIVVPDTAPELALDKEYTWSVALICNPARPSTNVFVQGRIRRIAADLAITAADPLSTAQAYAQAGVW